MTRYRLYNLRGFKLVASGEIDAASDEEAVRIARAEGRGDRVEIWAGARKVSTVSPLNPVR